MVLLLHETRIQPQHTRCAPRSIAILPRQLGAQRRKHVEYRPSDDHIVVEHNDGRHNDHADAESLEQRTKSLVHGNRTERRVLAERQFHEHERQPGDDQHYGERYEECTCLRVYREKQWCNNKKNESYRHARRAYFYRNDATMQSHTTRTHTHTCNCPKLTEAALLFDMIYINCCIARTYMRADARRVR